MTYLNWLKTIEYTEDLDGGGKILAPVFAELLKNIQIDTCYEWCCGPGWIGLWLLELGICKKLVASDINPKAIKYLNRTIKKHNYNAKTYVSDNLKDIPKQKFDIVVSNPPNYSNIQTNHTSGYMRNDLRPSDIDWKIHKDFYKNIKQYLKPNSKLYISEVEPYNKKVVIGKELYDLRDNVPINDFKKMLKDNDLSLNDVLTYDINIGDEILQMGILKIALKP